MADENKQTDLDIDESGFESGWQDDASHEQARDTQAHVSDDVGANQAAYEEEYESHGKASGVNKIHELKDSLLAFIMTRNGMIAAGVAVVVVMLLFVFSTNSETEYADLDLLVEPTIASASVNTATTASSANVERDLPVATAGMQQISVEQDQSGVKVNGHQDIVASMLLQNYPTRDDLVKELKTMQDNVVTKETLDEVIKQLTSELQKTRAAMAQQTAAGNVSNDPVDSTTKEELFALVSDLNSNMVRLQKNLALQRQELLSIKQELAELEKNSGWYHNRILDLEKNKRGQRSSSKTSTVAKTVSKNTGSWTINGASDSVAFIQHSSTGQRLRVTRGFDVPGCGQVVEINPAKQRIKTASCVITN